MIKREEEIAIKRARDEAREREKESEIGREREIKREDSAIKSASDKERVFVMKGCLVLRAC